MNKIKNIFLLLTVGVVVMYSCSDNANTFVNPFLDVNHEELSMSDSDSIVKFLNTHYYDATVDSVKTLVSGKTSLLDDPKMLEPIIVTDNEIDHELYVYMRGEEGISLPAKSHPTIVDSVFVKYSGQSLIGAELQTINFDKNDNGIWFTLDAVVKGWTKGFTKFKGGENITGNGPITYQNTGKGILFIPSGLAYPSSNANNYSRSLVDTNLMFYIELLDLVEDTDHDNDGKPSIQEDANGDGDPTNDFSDKSNPTVPDYLNPNY